MRVPTPSIVDNEDWFYDIVNPNAFINVNTRVAYPIEHKSRSNSSLRITTNLSIDELNEKMKVVPWSGVVATTGGLYSLTKTDISMQYSKHHKCLRAIPLPNTQNHLYL